MDDCLPKLPKPNWVKGQLNPLTDQGLGLQTDVNLWDTLHAHGGAYEKIRSAKHAT
jgi:hypothetical protein